MNDSGTPNEGPADEAADNSERARRFGKLPSRVLPDDLVALHETRTPEGRPGPAVSRAQQDALYGGVVY